jgi:hypothetical protein
LESFCSNFKIFIHHYTIQYQNKADDMMPLQAYESKSYDPALRDSKIGRTAAAART